MLWLIYEYYKLNEQAGSVYALTDFMAVKWKGDQQLESFWNAWNL